MPLDKPFRKCGKRGPLVLFSSGLDPSHPRTRSNGNCSRNRNPCLLTLQSKLPSLFSKWAQPTKRVVRLWATVRFTMASPSLLSSCCHRYRRAVAVRFISSFCKHTAFVRRRPVDKIHFLTNRSTPRHEVNLLCPVPPLASRTSIRGFSHFSRASDCNCFL